MNACSRISWYYDSQEGHVQSLLRVGAEGGVRLVFMLIPHVQVHGLLAQCYAVFS